MSVITPVRESTSSLVVRGIISILFALAILMWPGMSLIALTFAFGIYALVDGILALVSITAHKPSNAVVRPVLLVEGIAGIGFGLLTLAWPQVTLLMLLYFIAAWALVTGVLEIVAAIQLRDQIRHEWLLGLGGVVSVVLAVLLVTYPVSGILSLLLLIAAYALLFGALMLTLAWRRSYA